MHSSQKNSNCSNKSNVQYDAISGVRIGNFSIDSLWESVKSTVLSGKNGVVVAINPEKIMQANRDKTMSDILASFDFPIADGIGIVFVSKLRGGCVRHRLTGVYAMEAMADRSREIGASLFFYGAKPGIAEKAIEKLQERYPGIKVAGFADGYQKDADAVVEKIVASGANIVFVALGSPKQEYFMHECKQRQINCVFQGVGGSFDVISGTKIRAPLFFQRLGLEWFYRLVVEPWRLKRQIDILKFLVLAVFKKEKGGASKDDRNTQEE